MAVSDFTDWLGVFCAPGVALFVKRLSGNDTLANGAHQAGPYIPKDFLFRIFPMINRTDEKNPDHRFELAVDSHMDAREVRVIYYNSKRHEGKPNGRDETRLTNFGGGASALLDPESTGALAVFAFPLDDNGAATSCHVWVCRHETEEDIAEERFGPIEPGRFVMWSPEQPGLFPPYAAGRASCWLEQAEIPPAWLTQFPTGAEIVRKTVELRPEDGTPPDKRLLRRRECEFEIFRSVEEAIELPAIKAGFTTLDDFISRAQTVLQRRKARSGRSLELHTREILLEERFQEGADFEHGPQSEPGKRPDFLFPSQAAYRDPSFPAARLRMLATKTTCRDRWRQVLNEADRIPVKHLLTLQEGVSEAQFREMAQANVQLVVPEPLIGKFPSSIRADIQTLESFMGDLRLLEVAR
ncbi:type II restriction endonuclease [Thioclava nitratireducens]|uniref:type II restriction endonuclease n=1 Tax=Thioclava nitratireducens TaxID=1915078 RepID=UPI00247FD71C|nr:type II restriction endonuclease [Thioclava nitratireducens]WGT50361.1 type II restriction endonuclease [Thioclava nitratireducens]